MKHHVAEPVAVGQTAAEAVAMIPAWFAQEFDPALRLFMTSVDPEGAHKSRVALRRLRAVLQAFSGIIAPKLGDRLARRCRSYFRLLGHVRDADVLQAHLTRKADLKTAQKRNNMLRNAVRATLVAKGILQFSAKVHRALQGKRWHRASGKARAVRRAAAEVLAARSLQARFDHCLTYPHDPATLTEAHLHDFRKDLKVLRYQTEHFAPLWPSAAQDRFVASLRLLQDELGQVMDANLARIKVGAKGGAKGMPDHGVMAAARDHWHAIRQAGPWWDGSA